MLGGGSEAGFERALDPRLFSFPDDHGPHPEYRAEWWYFTGNLRSLQGRRFGYQLTFFRTALAPPGDPAATVPPGAPGEGSGPSSWRTSEVYMAHFALTDAEGGRFFAFDRFERRALGLAGAVASPWRVWVHDWSLQQEREDPFPLRLRARQRTEERDGGGGEISIDLTVRPEKGPVLQGDDGLSRKGPTPGNASYYYSFPRLDTRGTLRLGDRVLDVEGTSWLDREWSTSALEEGVVGWDWFALQLSDQTDLLVYRLRRSDGSTAPASSGALILPDGSTRSLPADSVVIDAQRNWQSSIDGVSYPVAWTLEVPDLGIALSVQALIDNQELDLAFRYWEGAVEASGSGSGGVAVTGRGYAELTGYADTARPRHVPR